MTLQDTPRQPPSISCFLLQGATGAVAWLVIGALDTLSPAAGTSALQAVTGFLILVACGAPGALGISIVQAMLMAKAQSPIAPIAMLLYAAAPGIGAYLGFAVSQRGMGIGRHLAGLRQRQIPLLVLATTFSTASLHAVAASTTGPNASSRALVQLALTNFIAIMLVMVTLLITIRAARVFFIAR